MELMALSDDDQFEYQKYSTLFWSSTILGPFRALAHA
jgi:hypothetical protein